VSGRRPFFARTGFSAYRAGRPRIYVAWRVLRRIISQSRGIGTLAILECSRDPRECRRSLTSPPALSFVLVSDAAFPKCRNSKPARGLGIFWRYDAKKPHRKNKRVMLRKKRNANTLRFLTTLPLGVEAAGFHRSSERGSYPLIQTRARDG